MTEVIQKDWIERRIYFLRRMKVMLSPDLAELYGVEPRSLIQALKRNLERFPSDFMFQLNNQEFMNLKSQSVISSWGGIRTPPQAIQVNIEIMRIFVQLRKYVTSHQELSDRLDKLEGKYNHQFKTVFDAIREIINPPNQSQRKIGFHSDEKT